MCSKPGLFGMKLFKHFFMAKMQAIEITDGEHTILVLFLAIMQAAYDLHGYWKDLILKVHILPVSVIARNEALTIRSRVGIKNVPTLQYVKLIF